MPHGSNYTWMPGPQRAPYAVRGRDVYRSVPSMSVAMRGINGVPEDIDNITASINASFDAGVVMLNDASAQGKIRASDVAAFDAEFTRLLDQFNALVGATRNADTLTQLQNIQAQLEGWRRRLAAKSSDTTLGRVFVWGGLAIVVAGGTAFYLINRTLKRRRRRSRR